jgi:hypothetical protein
VSRRVPVGAPGLDAAPMDTAPACRGAGQIPPSEDDLLHLHWAAQRCACAPPRSAVDLLTATLLLAGEPISGGPGPGPKAVTTWLRLGPTAVHLKLVEASALPFPRLQPAVRSRVARLLAAASDGRTLPEAAPLFRWVLELFELIQPTEVAPADQGSGVEASEDWMPFPAGTPQRRRFARHWVELDARRTAWACESRWREQGCVGELLRRPDARTVLATRGTLRYDTQLHPLREAFAEVVGLRADSLTSLHTGWANFSADGTHLDDKAALLAPLLNPETRERFERSYDAWMLAVAVPDAARSYERAMSAAADGEGAAAFETTAMLYQAFPCIRVQQPTNYATIKPHTDAMYVPLSFGAQH